MCSGKIFGGRDAIRKGEWAKEKQACMQATFLSRAPSAFSPRRVAALLPKKFPELAQVRASDIWCGCGAAKFR